MFRCIDYNKFCKSDLLNDEIYDFILSKVEYEYASKRTKFNITQLKLLYKHFPLIINDTSYLYKIFNENIGRISCSHIIGLYIDYRLEKRSVSIFGCKCKGYNVCKCNAVCKGYELNECSNLEFLIYDRCS